MAGKQTFRNMMAAMFLEADGATVQALIDSQSNFADETELVEAYGEALLATGLLVHDVADLEDRSPSEVWAGVVARLDG